MADPLDMLANATYCPACGCLDGKGSVRCPECSTFHSGAILEEREAPVAAAPAREVDPSLYSLSGKVSAEAEEFEEAEHIRSWSGGSTDFSFDDGEDEPPTKIEDVAAYVKELPSPEDLLED